MAKKYAGAGAGSGVSYTPDPTVNGPWTHTRPDIPLFKTAPAAVAPSAGTPSTLPGTGASTLPGVVKGPRTYRDAVQDGFTITPGNPNPKHFIDRGPSPVGVANPKMNVANPMRDMTPGPVREMRQMPRGSMYPAGDYKSGTGMALGGAGRGQPQIEDPPLPPFNATQPMMPTAPAPTGVPPVSPSGPPKTPFTMGSPGPAPAKPGAMGAGYRTKMANALARPVR
jgi:hypothetical protein